MPNPERLDDSLISNSPEETSVLEQAPSADRSTNQALGAKILTQSGFEQRHKGIVDSSFNKATKRGEKLRGKNSERRNFAYIDRLEGLVAKHGNALEQKLWKRSIEQLIVEPKNIPDSYWRTQEQILRDEGHGNVTLGPTERQTLATELQKQQRESLESWSNYLGDERSPYPMWFKVYAWDGMSKMGVFDKPSSQFKKRDKSTVAPYPHLNPAALTKVFDAITDFYNHQDAEAYTESSERDQELMTLVRSGNFNKLYSKLLIEEKHIVETPKHTEDVHGQWQEYKLGDEEKLATAAEGTPWCIASSSIGRNYLSRGDYGDDWNEDYDEETIASSQARFLLFHLQDPETNTLSENACASIRLDAEGRVAEISGLNDGQALEDSLVPIVEAKVKTLPGGEDFLVAFADKKHLIALDRKMQEDQPLTKEDYEFLYELNREIRTLDTYNNHDPRISELKAHYSINDALDAGVDVDQMMAQMYPNNIAQNLNTLLEHGADANNIMSSLSNNAVVRHLDILIKHGADIDIDELISKVSANIVAENLDALIKHGASIDIDKLVSDIRPATAADNLDALIKHGANININQLISDMQSSEITMHLDTLLKHGAHIDQLVSKMEESNILAKFDSLITYGANVDQLISKMSPDQIADKLDTLLQHGAKIDVSELVTKLKPSTIAFNLDTLANHGINIDINELVSKIHHPLDIYYTLDTLLEHGANVDQLVPKMDSGDILENLDTLIAHGADVNQLVLWIESDDILENLDTLIEHNAKIDEIVSVIGKRNYNRVIRNLDTLIEHGASINKIVSDHYPYGIITHLDTLIEHGAQIDINKLVSDLVPLYIKENLNILLEHGANPALIQARLKAETPIDEEF